MSIEYFTNVQMSHTFLNCGPENDTLFIMTLLAQGRKKFNIIYLISRLGKQ